MRKYHTVVIVLGLFAILFGASALTAQTDFSIKIYAERRIGMDRFRHHREVHHSHRWDWRQHQPDSP